VTACTVSEASGHFLVGAFCTVAVICAALAFAYITLVKGRPPWR
jgi:hypothetical protein